MKSHTKQMFIISLLIPLMFGFLLWGGSGSGSGFVGIQAANKVVAPSFGAGISGSLSLSAAPLFRPAFQPARFNAFGSFRWNFFDP